MKKPQASIIKMGLARIFISGICSTLLMFSFCGCVTTRKQAEADTRLRADILLLREDLIRVQGRVESVEMEYERTQNELARLNKESSLLNDKMESMKTQLDQQGRGMAELNSARVKDREMIIEDLSARIADMLAKRGSAAGRAATGVSTGYEHIVQPGEPFRK